MAELKTKKTEVPVSEFVAGIKEEEIRKDTQKLVKLMEKASGAKGKMWGPAIIGFGDHRLVYESGRELDWFKIGFSPRKGKFSIYAMSEIMSDEKLMAKLGKHKTSKGCLYVTKLSDVDEKVLLQLLEKSVINLAKKKK